MPNRADDFFFGLLLFFLLLHPSPVPASFSNTVRFTRAALDKRVDAFIAYLHIPRYCTVLNCTVLLYLGT